MAWRNTDQTFGWATIILHWMMALAILVIFGIGWYMVELDYYDPLYHQLPDLHKALGIVIGLLLAIRIVWHLSTGLPKPLAGLSTWELTLSGLVHKTLYLLLLASVTSGYLICTAQGAAVDVFGWFSIPALPALVEEQEEVAGEWHEVFVYALIGLVTLHALAALKHHFLDKDDTLRRMLGLRRS
jgi:cytochrome b561